VCEGHSDTAGRPTEAACPGGTFSTCRHFTSSRVPLWTWLWGPAEVWKWRIHF